MQCALTWLLVYTVIQFRLVYMPSLTLDKLHLCLVHVDNEHCGDPTTDWFTRPVDPDSLIKLSPGQQHALINHYAEMERVITVKDDCLIGTGYNNCLDVGFHAVDLFHALRPEIVSLQESKDEELRPRMHPAINNLESFVETFLYFFEQGSNAEFVSLDKDLFTLFLDRLYEGENAAGQPITLHEEIGGHSSVWT